MELTRFHGHDALSVSGLALLAGAALAALQLSPGARRAAG
jgi:hypothetical protein